VLDGHRSGLGMPRSSGWFQWLRADVVMSLELLNVSVHVGSETMVFQLASSSSWSSLKFT
jgi:hypothetical protein